MTIEFIISILKAGGYIAFYSNYNTANLGSKHLNGTQIQGVMLKSKQGTEWVLKSVHIINQVKQLVNLREEKWEHKPTNSYGVEYYLENNQ